MVSDQILLRGFEQRPVSRTTSIGFELFPVFDNHDEMNITFLKAPMPVSSSSLTFLGYTRYALNCMEQLELPNPFLFDGSVLMEMLRTPSSMGDEPVEIHYEYGVAGEEADGLISKASAHARMVQKAAYRIIMKHLEEEVPFERPQMQFLLQGYDGFVNTFATKNKAADRLSLTRAFSTGRHLGMKACKLSFEGKEYTARFIH